MTPEDLSNPSPSSSAPTASPRIGGVGLGVSTHIVESHGGRLTFESIPAHGTKVQVWLPLFAEPLAQCRGAIEP
jgi:signal transduction histidine kinase